MFSRSQKYLKVALLGTIGQLSGEGQKTRCQRRWESEEACLLWQGRLLLPSAYNQAGPYEHRDVWVGLKRAWAGVQRGAATGPLHGINPAKRWRTALPH